MKNNIKTKLKFIIIGICCFSIFASDVTYAQEKISLERAVEIALQNNLQVKQVQLSQLTSEENLKQSRLALYPTLNANNNLNFNFGRSIDPLTNQFDNNSIVSTNGNLFSSVTLFQGFQRMNQISQNKYFLEADKSSTQKAKNDLSLAVVTNYLQVLSNQDLLEAAKQQLQLSNQILRREEEFFKVGNKTLADLSQAKAQVAASELNEINAQNQLDLSFLNLAQLMELDPNTRFEVEKPIVENVGQINSGYSSKEVIAKAIDNYPDIKVAEFERMAFAKGVEIAKGNFYPRLVLQGSLGTGYSNARQRVVSRSLDGTFSPIGQVRTTGQIVETPNFSTVLERTPFQAQIDENFNQAISFGLSIPIFNGYSARTTVRKAKISAQNADLSLQLAKNNLNKVITQAVWDLKAAEKRYASAQSAFVSSKDAFSAIEQRYDVGLVNSLDYNQSQTNLNRAQFDLIQAKYDLIFRSKVIDFYLGNPLTF